MEPIAPDDLLAEMFRCAVRAADPTHCLARHLPARSDRRTIVLGAGKAAASMSRAVEKHMPTIAGGLVITRYGHALSCDKIEVVEAAHPVPDERGLDAAERVLAMARSATEDDLILFLISGGASALLTLPGDGRRGSDGDLNLQDKQDINRALLKSGANITEMNTVRKHLSAIKGGRLAAAASPASLLTLAISDVPGDDPAVIGSGPTVADQTSSADARNVLQRYNIPLSDTVQAFLASNAAETPKPDDPVFAKSDFVLIARPQVSLEAAAEFCRSQGCTPIILGDAIEGEAREVALEHAELAIAAQKTLGPGNLSQVLISGGETTVTVRGNGRGGRNAEYLLALAIALDGAPGIHAIACDTDGIDGSEDNAGARIGPDSLVRARAIGIDPGTSLDDNDGYTVFQALDDLIMTGPTLTNVNDFRAILVMPGPTSA